MNFSTESQNNVYIITINQEIANIELTKEFKELMFGLIEREAKGIIIDFSMVGLIDSTFLGSIVVSHKKIKDSGGQIKICNLSENVFLSFGLSKINTIIDVYDNKQEAINSFN